MTKRGQSEKTFSAAFHSRGYGVYENIDMLPLEITMSANDKEFPKCYMVAEVAILLL